LIFLDTGAFVARFIARDEHHARAARAWRRLERSGDRLFTGALVVAEAVTYLARHAGGAFAAERGRSLLASSAISVLRSDPDDENSALGLLERFADQRLSFTDAVSFALMRRHGLKRAFTFDRHFVMAGFVRWPDD
jgi:predicted nucleic acid-binding protein